MNNTRCILTIFITVIVLLIMMFDIYIILFVWHNPSIFFKQVKIGMGWGAAYLLGMITVCTRDKNFS